MARLTKTRIPLQAASQPGKGEATGLAIGRELFLQIAMVLVAISVGFGSYLQLGLGFWSAAVAGLVTYGMVTTVHALMHRMEALRRLTLENERLQLEIIELRSVGARAGAHPPSGVVQAARAPAMARGAGLDHETDALDLRRAGKPAPGSAATNATVRGEPSESPADEADVTIAPWPSPLSQPEADAASSPPLTPNRMAEGDSARRPTTGRQQAGGEVQRGRVPVPQSDLQYFPNRDVVPRTSPPPLAGDDGRDGMQVPAANAAPPREPMPDEIVARSIEALRQTARMLDAAQPEAGPAATATDAAAPPRTAAPAAAPVPAPSAAAATPWPPVAVPVPTPSPAAAIDAALAAAARSAREAAAAMMASMPPERTSGGGGVRADAGDGLASRHEAVHVGAAAVTPAMMLQSEEERRSAIAMAPMQVGSAAHFSVATSHAAGAHGNAAADEIEEALLADRLRITLQSIAELGTRRTDRIEIAAELPLDGDRTLDAARLAEVAAGTGLLPLVDVSKLMAVEQVLGRLALRKDAPGLVSGFSGESLLDNTFLDGFAEVAENQSEMAAKLLPAFTQAEVRHFTAAQWGTLQTMVEHGFRFMMSAVTDLDIDFAELKARGFDFVKLDAEVFLGGMAASEGAVIPARDICRHLTEQGLAVVVGRIDDERLLAEIMGFGVLLGQGTLFGAPKPMRVEQRSRVAAAAPHAAVA